MKRRNGLNIFIFSIICLLSNSNIFAQSDPIKVKYLNFVPVIDGKADALLHSIPEYKFSKIEATSKNLTVPDAGYKIAYNSEFLYLLIRVNTDSVIFRDRAYQNGDGFHMVIAMPKANNEDTDEFYVLRFSPASIKNKFAGLKGVWYYNIDLTGRRLSRYAEFEVSSKEGETCYELLLPWNEIAPYHPFMKEGMGFNLCCVKAAGKSDKIFYYALYDKKIQWEQNKRKYFNISFEKPLSEKNILAQFFPDKKSIYEGSEFQGELNVYSPKDTTLDFTAAVVSSDNSVFSSVTNSIKLTQGFSSHRIAIPSSEVIDGSYSIRWRFADEILRYIPVTVLPAFQQDRLFKMLGGSSSSFSDGTRNTMIWRVKEINESLKKLKSYESSGSLRNKIVKLERDVNRINAGDDFYKKNKGIFRRAYLAKLDTTYQPYSIKLPNDFDPAKKYPLLVVLHGSGQDDQGMLNGEDFGNSKFILAAPNGRGTSNCYSTPGSQDDIKECIEDVIANYNIDETRIVLAGFSMGGYGVFRTFYQTPGRFAGIAIFSGHPNLANKWMTGSHPDFTDINTLNIFKSIPVFIYHDKIDLNCPYEVMERTVNLLKQQGTNLEFVASSGMGHNILNETNKESYYNWLDSVLKTGIKKAR